MGRGARRSRGGKERQRWVWTETRVAGEGSGTGETDGLLDTVSGQNKRLFTNRWRTGGRQAERRSRRRGIPNTTHCSAGLNPIAESRGGKWGRNNRLWLFGTGARLSSHGFKRRRLVLCCAACSPLPSALPPTRALFSLRDNNRLFCPNTVKKSGRVFSPPKQAGDRRAGPTWMPTAIPADALKLEIAAKAPSFVSFASALLVSLAGVGCGDFAARRGVRGQGRTYGPSGKFAIPTAVR